VLGIVFAGLAADPYDETLEKYFSTDGEVAIRDESKPDLTTEQLNIAALESALKRETRTLALGPPIIPPPAGYTCNRLYLTLFLLLSVRLTFPRLIRRLNMWFDPWAPTAVTAARVADLLCAEEKAFAAFVQIFRIGQLSWVGAPPVGPPVWVERDPVARFYSQAGDLLRQVNQLLPAIVEAPSEPERQARLGDLQRELAAMKDAAVPEEVRVVRQMAAALAGLVQQLVNQVRQVGPSTLRTVAGGLDLLNTLCVPGVPADLLSNPPIRLLAVDDDPIGRLALANALKKALPPPDLAANGETALALARKRAYDVIFLDVQMPGLDGFEICTKIHETKANVATPTVFVTTRNDFAARTQSVLMGGSDLLSKPFLSFELTVKALTFILKGRLQKLDLPAKLITDDRFPIEDCRDRRRECARVAVGTPETTGPRPVPVDPLIINRDVSPVQSIDRRARELPSPAVTREFLNRATGRVNLLKQLIQAASDAQVLPARQESLEEFYLCLNGMLPPVGRRAALEHPVLRLSRALAALLENLFKHPEPCPSSSLLTLATAVEVLEELCADELSPDLAIHPVFRILAVDDNPVSLRLITSALQRVCNQPENATSGVAAVAAAAEKPFDVIFMDVHLPGMDGFAACLKIHETGVNQLTPVVFLTGQNDFEARLQASQSGGSDFVVKPFLTAEIIVKALTYALRGRLQKTRFASPPVAQVAA